jgi:hypothetical protein
MRSFARHGWLAATVLAASAELALAQQAPANPEAGLPEEPVKYRVEFIIFAHAEADPYEELFDKEASDAALPREMPVPFGRPFGGGSDPGSGGGPAPAPEGAESTDDLKPIVPPDGGLPADTEPFWFRVLDAGELALADTYARLDNLRAYRLLASGGWIQEGLEESAARPINLANLGIVNPAGSLRLHVSRFLHLGVDLEFRAQPFADAGNAADPLALAELAPLGTKYRMVAQRRARSGELHYVDHPMFGLLFLISPAPEENVPVDDDTSVLAPAI